LVESNVNDCYRAGVVAIALTFPLLQGCAGAVVALQAIPVAIGGVAAANAEDRSPFRTQIQNPQPWTDRDLAMLDAHIRRAECGNAESQYWLGSALKNDFNATPDNVEIYKWYRLAEMKGFAPATEELTALDATMSESAIAEARARAREWQPTTEDCPVGG
jgi:TPR repeat protein